MTETKSNGTRRLYWIMALIVSAIVIFVFVQTQMSATVANHPKIVKMETVQKQTCAELKEINEQLKDMNRKLTKLLMEEYP